MGGLDEQRLARVGQFHPPSHDSVTAASAGVEHPEGLFLFMSLTDLVRWRKLGGV